MVPEPRQPGNSDFNSRLQPERQQGKPSPRFRHPMHHAVPVGRSRAIAKVGALQEALEVREVAIRRLWEGVLPLALSLALSIGAAEFGKESRILMRCLTISAMTTFLLCLACADTWRQLWSASPVRREPLKSLLGRARRLLTVVSISYWVLACASSWLAVVALASERLWTPVLLGIGVAAICVFRSRRVLQDRRRIIPWVLPEAEER